MPMAILMAMAKAKDNAAELISSMALELEMGGWLEGAPGNFLLVLLVNLLFTINIKID
jgi:hypothetical protein